MTIEIHELVIRAEVQNDSPVVRQVTLSRDEREKLIAQVVASVLRELRYQQEQRL